MCTRVWREQNACRWTDTRKSREWSSSRATRARIIGQRVKESSFSLTQFTNVTITLITCMWKCNLTHRSAVSVRSMDRWSSTQGKWNWRPSTFVSTLCTGILIHQWFPRKRSWRTIEVEKVTELICAMLAQLASAMFLRGRNGRRSYLKCWNKFIRV